MAAIRRDSGYEADADSEVGSNRLNLVETKTSDGGIMQSPNEMMLDPEEYVVEPPETVKDDEAIALFPDHLKNGNTEQVSEIPLANDFEAMKEYILTPLAEEPEILADAVHTWQIEDWRTLGKKEHGPVFEAGGSPWRVLMFPFGNNVDYCSFYLEQGFPDGKPPEDWYCCVQFSLVLWNPNDPSIFLHHTAHHRFTKDEGDWGFTRFVELRKLFNTPWETSSRPMVEEESANMTAYVRVVKDETGVLWHNFINYDSKKETGFVGLKNQGATCYLNSLLQSLYFTNAFRMAVYQIPTQNEDSLQNSAYALQRLFYQLQNSSSAVGTNELTKSFGWETRHIFEQQDVQELSRKLMERLEEKMKGTESQNVLPKLFSGKQKTYISCINVPYESSRVEDFWDVQLNVSGNKNIEDSFRDYVQVEKMDGENQYFAGEQYKLQDANKGVIFQSFPEVLHLQLKRFEYDIERDAMTKINARYEFPEIFDATPYLSEEADKSEPYTYQLHGVLVHSGDLNAGHYYAFIKPTKDGIFYKYDDDKVTRATMREVLEDNFGGEIGHTNGHVKAHFQNKMNGHIRQNSAYMLVYIRQSRLNNVLLEVTAQDTPPHLHKKLKEEADLKEMRKKERDEQHLYLLVRVVTSETYQAHAGTDLAIWEDPEKYPAAARAYRVLRTSTVQDLASTVAEELKEDSRKVRFWCMVNRQNKTIRPDQPIVDGKMTIDEVYLKLAGTKLQDLRLWAEIAEEVDSKGEPVWPALTSQAPAGSSTNQNILLFLKWFDVEHQVLRGAGHLYIGKERKVEELVPQILKKMGWPEKTATGDKTQLRLFEEIKPQMIDAMKAKQTLKAAELQDGDIVCFQRAPEKGSESDKDSAQSVKLSGWIEDAQNFYDYLLHRRVIKLVPHPKSLDKREQFEIELSGKFTYDQMAARVGEKLDVDPTHIRFHTVNLSTGNVRAAVKRNATQTLQAILTPPYSTFGNNNQRSDALYFEVLDMSLAEFDTKKNLKIIWLSEGITKEEYLDVLVPKNGNVGDLITGLIKKADLEDEATKGAIRVYETHNSKLYKELPRDFTVMSITDYINLVAERIPEEEANTDPGHSIYAFHFQGEPNKPHGMPFIFHIKADEKFGETKKRLEKRTGIKGKAFEKIKFAVVKRGSYSKPIYLTDDDILWEVASAEDDLLGLDHIDRSRQMRNGVGDLFLK